MKLENKPYSRLVGEGFVILPPETDITAYCKHVLEGAGFVILTSDKFIPGTGLVIGNGAHDSNVESVKTLETMPASVRTICDTQSPDSETRPVESQTLTADSEIVSGRKIDRKHRKHREERHPLADLSVDALNNKVKFNGKEYQGNTLRIATEKALAFGTNNYNEHEQSVYAYVDGLPPHENRTIILDILKPEVEVK